MLQLSKKFNGNIFLEKQIIKQSIFQIVYFNLKTKIVINDLDNGYILETADQVSLSKVQKYVVSIQHG